MNKKITHIRLFWDSVFVSIFLIIELCFKWFFSDHLLFFEPLLLLVLVLLNLISFIGGVIYFCKNKEIKHAWLPITFNIIALLLFFLFSSTTLYIRLYFLIHDAQYQEVVRILEEEKPIDGILPDDYKNLSNELGVSIESGPTGKSSKAPTKEELNYFGVFFKRGIGFSDNFSGYAYVSNDDEPTNMNFSCGMIVDLIKLKDHWYWMSCT